MQTQLQITNFSKIEKEVFDANKNIKKILKPILPHLERLEKTEKVILPYSEKADRLFKEQKELIEKIEKDREDIKLSFLELSNPHQRLINSSIKESLETVEKAIRPVLPYLKEAGENWKKYQKMKQEKEKRVLPVCFLSNETRRRESVSPTIRQNINITINIQQVITKDFIRPKVSQWDEFSIKFINSHDIEIKYGRTAYKATCSDLGFMSQTTLKPKKTWKLLERFATNYGEITNKTKNRIPNFKQKLSALRTELKQCFGIADDPFQNKKNGNCRIKIDIAG